ncbi:MAG TPA: hypothetical protein VHD87_01510, partial [Acidimicrobiales bacterium]|nr:hypothetical protein [Acidimicrobiales bacterium]
DTDAIEELEFPVFNSMIALTGAQKKQGGTINQAVTVGDVEVNPGDWVVGDTDGVVVIPRAQLSAVLEAATARYENEQELFRQLKEGATTIELLGLDPKGLDKS